MLALLYGLHACPLNKTDINGLDFVVNQFFMKLFCTSDDMNIVLCVFYAVKCAVFYFKVHQNAFFGGIPSRTWTFIFPLRNPAYGSDSNYVIMFAV